MVFEPFAVSTPHVVYACLGGFVALFGMFSLLLREKLYIGEACWAFLFGVVVGPYGANIFNPRGWGGDTDKVTNTITLEFTRIVLAIGVFAIGVELPKAYMARHWKSLFFLLVPVMTWGWFVSAGLIYALIPGLNFLSSLAVAACLTPTDPILAAAVVGGKYADKHVPAHIRHLLAAESACNDGAAFPFLYIALYLIIDSPHTGKAIRDWVLIVWLYEVILGVIIGATIGFAFRHLMKFCQRHDLIDRQSYVAQYVSLAIFTIGVTTLLGSDDLLAAFACGTAFAWDGFFNRQTEEAVFSSVIDLLFNIAAFVFVGAWMPFSSFQDATTTLSVWRLIVIAILVLLLRRLPAMIALYRWIPDVKTFREAVFSGHFGPIGVGAVFISTLAKQVLNDSDHEGNAQTELLARTIQPIVAFMVLCSITIHGLSIPSFSLGRRVHTVSRTWSRHAPPDWTNQARLVDRGAEDIIINRDIDVERGEPTLEDKSPQGSRTRTVSEAGASIPPEKVVEGESLEAKREHLQDTQVNEETPPDGNEIISEWQEGRHRIIERRAGPGEEVEVEVIRNVDGANDTKRSVLSFRGHKDVVHHHLSAYMDKLRHNVHGLEHDAERLAVTAEHKFHEVLSPQSSHVDRKEGGGDGDGEGEGEGEGEEEEEGWASDQSNGDQTVPAADTSRKRSKSPKQKIAAKLGSAPPSRKSRRRNSIRRNLIGNAQQFMHAHHQVSSHTSLAEAVGLGESRGRFFEPRFREPSPTLNFDSRPGTPPHSTHPGTGPSSIRHHRLDSIKALHSPSSTRDSSPARSVRFADNENKSGTNTPRLSVYDDYSPGESVSGEEPDSARNKVTFGLPKPLKQ